MNLTEATDRQIEYLEKRGFGSFTQIVRTAIDRMYREERNNMMPQDLIRNLELEYHGLKKTNPNWEMTLWDFLISRKVHPDDIWGYSPQIGYDADQPEPDWL